KRARTSLENPDDRLKSIQNYPDTLSSHTPRGKARRFKECFTAARGGGREVGCKFAKRGLYCPICTASIRRDAVVSFTLRVFRVQTYVNTSYLCSLRCL
ncbi:hypothetical protein J6590_046128, partial [Homalodisca vitripennis]